MSAVEQLIDEPLDRQQLAKRWQAVCADPSFEDLAAKIELTAAAPAVAGISQSYF